MSVNIIACVNESWQLGNSKTNDLLYKIKHDLKRFKEKTMNNYCVYGRNTYESLPKLFSGRTNVILTRNQKFGIPQELHEEYDVIIENDLTKILSQYCNSGHQERDLFICGGVEIFAEGLHYADKLYLTLVHDSCHEEGDVYFPVQELSEFKIIHKEKHFDEESGLYYSFIDYVRKGDVNGE